MKQNISHQAVVDADGTIIDTVIITRRHEGDESEKLYGKIILTICACTRGGQRASFRQRLCLAG